MNKISVTDFLLREYDNAQLQVDRAARGSRLRTR